METTQQELSAAEIAKQKNTELAAVTEKCNSFVTFSEAVAVELTKITSTEWKIQNLIHTPCAHNWQNEHVKFTNGEVSFRMGNSWNKNNKYHAHGTFPKEHPYISVPTISFTLPKTAKTLAGDISRRLLPELAIETANRRAKYENNIAAAKSAEEACQAIIAANPTRLKESGSSIRKSRDNNQVTEREVDLRDYSGDFQIYAYYNEQDGGITQRISLKLNSLTLEQACEIAKLLK